MAIDKLETSELGKHSAYTTQYDPSLLFQIPRKTKRDEIGIIAKLPFAGVDIWNAFELSWLNTKGKPIIALLELIIPANSSHIIESKSLKLYLNSLNNTQFSSQELVKQTINNDLAKVLNIAPKELIINIYNNDNSALQATPLTQLKGICLDELDVSIQQYTPNPKLLKTDNNNREESLFSNLLKSNCLVTDQPDWGSVQIDYQGKQINHESLLKYIIAFRNHNEFHEQCIERIFMDIMRECQPEKLTVYGRYTRRGGLDINPYRTTNQNFITPSNARLFRQ